jgi:hypothetical protein
LDDSSKEPSKDIFTTDDNYNTNISYSSTQHPTEIENSLIQNNRISPNIYSPNLVSEGINAGKRIAKYL